MLARRLLLFVLLLLGPLPARAGGDPLDSAFPNFETVPVRPLALSPDGTHLFAVNTPDARLEIFDVTPRGIFPRASVAVGLEPVAVAARTDAEVWVVNHLSDSVTVVDVASRPPRVVRTLLVGDEPWDIVFAGPRDGPDGPFRRAFVSAARRGQNHPEGANAELKTPSLGRADVWVFDAKDPGEAFGGVPETIVRVFGDKPRALAASPDGTRVYVGIFHSGNRTATVNGGAVCDGGSERGPCTLFTVAADEPPAEGPPGSGSPPILPGGLPEPNEDAAGNPMPEIGLIVHWDEASGEWRDVVGRNWNGAVPFELPDLDVFALDALADPPVEVAAYAGVGTILYDLAVHPDGGVYVANTEARNDLRFEGPGVGGEPTVRGHIHEMRVTRIGPDGAVAPHLLNPHIDYDAFPPPAGTSDASLSLPVSLAFDAAGDTLWVAALGSAKVSAIDTASLDDGSFSPDPSDHVDLTGSGPCGLVVDELRRRLYVYTRFDGGVSVVDLDARRELARVPLPNPEPDVVRMGRRFLYDARLTSSNGEASCAVCHVLGDKDDLAWNLGDPTQVQVPNPNPFIKNIVLPKIFHPLKGPFTTQTLRGLAGHGPMHWRGDRTGANDPESGDPFDEDAAFRAFNVAFGGLLGRVDGPLPPADMELFSAFALTIVAPPSPVRRLDNTERPNEASGRDTFFNHIGAQGRCNGCHRLDPPNGFFGTSGHTVFDGGPQHGKIPHLRNIYDKLGAFGTTLLNPLGNAGFSAGPQVRGFGLSSDGSLGSIRGFIGFGFVFPRGDAQAAEVEDFVLAFPGELAPIVGQQVTLGPGSGASAHERLALLVERALAPWPTPRWPDARECDLVARGTVAGEARGYWGYPGSSFFLSDRRGEPPLSLEALLALAAQPGQDLTFTCAPPGRGMRMAIDRDGDRAFDGDERDRGTDPAQAGSVAGACGDGLDNDRDGRVDWPDDAECAGPLADSEIASPIAIDIEPFRPRNRISDGQSRVRVALLGSHTTDLATSEPRDPAFGPGAAPPLSDASGAPLVLSADVNGDSFLDRVWLFDVAAAGLAPGDAEACLEAELDGSTLRACDAVLFESPACGLGFEVALVLPPLLAWRRRLRGGCRRGHRPDRKSVV